MMLADWTNYENRSCEDWLLDALNDLRDSGLISVDDFLKYRRRVTLQEDLGSWAAAYEAGSVRSTG